MPAAQTPRRVVVLHGYSAHPGKHWFGALADDLLPSGISVLTPALPDSSDPHLDAWLQTARDAIGTPDAGLVVIGHSLGGITALKALAGLQGDWELGGLILVSAFDTHLPNLPALSGFTQQSVDYTPIIHRTRSRRMIVSDNDTIVAPTFSQNLAAALDAGVTVIPGGGHFRQDDGYTSFPEVASAVRSILA